jgi:hypothetical protein
VTLSSLNNDRPYGAARTHVAAAQLGIRMLDVDGAVTSSRGATGAHCTEQTHHAAPSQK